MTRKITDKGNQGGKKVQMKSPSLRSELYKVELQYKFFVEVSATDKTLAIQDALSKLESYLKGIGTDFKRAGQAARVQYPK